MAVPSILMTVCDPFLAGIYGRKFELDGWDVEVVESMQQGQEQASKMRPSVLLIDVDCVADFPAEVKKLKQLPTLMKTKIVALASRGDRAAIQAAREAGVDSYLVLGHFVPQEVVTKMKKLIES